MIILPFDKTIEITNPSNRKAVLFVQFEIENLRTLKGNQYEALRFTGNQNIKVKTYARTDIGNLTPFREWDIFQEACTFFQADINEMNFTCNCHGWTFLDGKYRIERTDFIKTILVDEFELVSSDEKYLDGDVVVYLKDDSANELTSIADLKSNSIVHSCKIKNDSFSHKIGDRAGEKIYAGIRECDQDYCGIIQSHLVFRKKQSIVNDEPKVEVA